VIVATKMVLQMNEERKKVEEQHQATTAHEACALLCGEDEFKGIHHVAITFCETLNAKCGTEKREDK